MSVSNVRSRLGVTRFMHMHFQKDEAEHEHITSFIWWIKHLNLQRTRTSFLLCCLLNVGQTGFQANQTLSVTFSLDSWPRSCCQFDVQVKPFKPVLHSDASLIIFIIILILIILHHAVGSHFTWVHKFILSLLQIKPYFSQCGEDCTRRRKTQNICPSVTKGPAGQYHVWVRGWLNALSDQHFIK